MYLKYHKAGLTPTTPVTSTAIFPVKMTIGHKSLTNLHSEMIFLQGKPVFSSPDPNPKGQVSYCHHLASVVVVRRKLFQKSSPLKVLDQWKPNLV